MDNLEEKSLLKSDNNDKTQYSSPIQHFTHSLMLIAKSEVSLILMFITNFLVSIQFYILVTLIPLYFSSELGFSDLFSGLIFGGFGVVIGISSIYLSSILHIISLKRGLICSCILGILGFSIMMIHNTALSLISVLTLQAISCSLAWPFVEYGIKEYSTPEIRTLSSSCFFMSNYLAGIITGVSIDLLWNFVDDKTLMYKIVYAAGIAALLASIIIVSLCRKIEYTREEEINNYNGVTFEKRFWRFTALVLILILLYSGCFCHLDATLPTYMVRTENRAHFGVMLMIHSITMMVGVFVLTPLTFSYSSYTLIVAGGFIGVSGSCFLIFSNELYALVLFVVFVSIGESIWVPRLLDYTFTVAPEGQEGVYLAISNCPFYFGMILTGASSGMMLDKFCPEDNTENCHFIWLTIFCSSMCFPLALIVLKQVLVQPEQEGKAYIPSFNSEKLA